MADLTKLVTVQIDNSRILWSIESAFITVTSPTGRQICLDKHKLLWVREELKTVFWKCCGNELVEYKGPREITIEEMALCLEYANFSHRK
jgi:hypothetical protein